MSLSHTVNCLCIYLCIALYCIVLHCIAWHGMAWHGMAWHGMALYCIALHCIPLYCMALHCIVVHSIVLHGIALYCINQVNIPLKLWLSNMVSAFKIKHYFGIRSRTAAFNWGYPIINQLKFAIWKRRAICLSQ